MWFPAKFIYVSIRYYNMRHTATYTVATIQKYKATFAKHWLHCLEFKPVTIRWHNKGGRRKLWRLILFISFHCRVTCEFSRNQSLVRSRYSCAILWKTNRSTSFNKSRFADVWPTRLPYEFTCDNRRSDMASCIKRLDKFIFSLRLLRNNQLQNERKKIILSVLYLMISGRLAERSSVGPCPHC